MLNLLEKTQMDVKDYELVFKVPEELSRQIAKVIELNRKNFIFLTNTVKTVFGNHFEILFELPYKIDENMRKKFEEKLDTLLDLFDGKPIGE